MWHTGAMAVPAAGLPCPVHCQSCSPVWHQVMSLMWRRQGHPSAPDLLSWGFSAPESCFYEAESRPSKCLAQFPAWFQLSFLQSERPWVLREEHLIGVISDGGSVIPAKRESGTSEMCCPVSTLKYQRWGCCHPAVLEGAVEQAVIWASLITLSSFFTFNYSRVSGGERTLERYCT